MKRRELKETRLERWLNEVARYLQTGGVDTTLLYDGHHGGDLLALVARTGTSETAGHWELLADRSGRHAVLRLLTDSSKAATRINVLLAGKHRAVPRRDNARRRFIHRLERMAAHLVETFERRRNLLPRRVLEGLPDARPLVGIERRWAGSQSAGVDADVAAGDGPAKTRRAARRFGTVWGVLVATTRGPRAAVYNSIDRNFRFGAEALTAAAIATAAAALTPGLLTPDSQQHQQRSEPMDSIDLGDAGDIVIDATGEYCWPDCDFIDLPDCSFIDLPDCSF